MSKCQSNWHYTKVPNHINTSKYFCDWRTPDTSANCYLEALTVFGLSNILSSKLPSWGSSRSCLCPCPPMDLPSWSTATLKQLLLLQLASGSLAEVMFYILSFWTRNDLFSNLSYSWIRLTNHARQLQFYRCSDSVRQVHQERQTKHFK